MPNIVLILTDDQGYGDLGCHGNSKVKTPNLDKMYQESVRFTQFYTSPLCSPTRAALLTGLYEWRSGVRATVEGRSLMRPDVFTIAEIFSASGFRTGIFGKWHLGDNYPLRAMDRGFQESIVHGGGGIGQTADMWGNTYFDPILCHNGRWKKFEGYCTDIFFNAAIKFIEKNKDRPFFVYIPTNAPHHPLMVDESYAEPYIKKGLPLDLAKFYGMITNIDENIGRLIENLKAFDLEDDTIIIFMSDNGGFTGVSHYNAGMRGHKGMVYEGGIRVPCFIRWPGTFSPKDVNQIAAHIDILPTLLDACKIHKPFGLSFDGTSLLPLILQEDAHWPNRALFFERGNIPDNQLYGNCAVRTQHYKLVNLKELYDMTIDPGENKNIADELPEIAENMRKMYDAWYRDVSIGLRDPVRISIGSIRENPTLITCEDWHDESVYYLWRQDMITERARHGLRGNGYWELNVERSGEYRIKLYKCHPKADLNLKTFKQGIARIIINDLQASQPISEGDDSITFNVELKAGPARLQTFLTGQSTYSEEVGAYYIEINYLIK